MKNTISFVAGLMGLLLPFTGCAPAFAQHSPDTVWAFSSVNGEQVRNNLCGHFEAVARKNRKEQEALQVKAECRIQEWKTHHMRQVTPAITNHIAKFPGLIYSGYIQARVEPTLGGRTYYCETETFVSKPYGIMSSLLVKCQ